MGGGLTARLLSHVRIDPARGGARAAALPFLRNGAVELALTRSLTFLIGENGCGKTTLLEAIAVRCGIRPGGGTSYAETEDERPGTALSRAVQVAFAGRDTKGLFLRADTFSETLEAVARGGALPMPATGEWREAGAQSRGEGVLMLLSASVEASDKALYLLDEPETGLSPARQMALLCILDEVQRDGRAQAVVATHSPILMSHPDADLLWVDDTGIERRALEEIPHYRDMRRFMRDPVGAARKLLE